MNRRQHTDFMILSGHVYKNGTFDIPKGWQELKTYSNTTGLQTSIYQKGNDIVISFRGTNSLLDFFGSDIPLGSENLPMQYKNANEIYQQIKKQYPYANITVTGHSLGGSLAQLVSAKNGCPAVTFNAYSTSNI